MRRLTARVLKLALLTFFLGLILFQGLLPRNSFERAGDPLIHGVPSSNRSSAPRGGSPTKVSSSLSGERTLRLPNNTLGGTGNTSGFSNYDVDGNNITEILRIIHEINAEEKIHNVETFGDEFDSNDTVVIVVQVHDRIDYLKELIGSFSQAKGIESVLLIFSHDVWNEEINRMIRSIDFTRVMQIFYPLSIQTHPREFPGQSPNDCPMNVKKERARELKCTNSEWPDNYGHYRDAKFTQIKHHWWWKANKVFYHIEVLKNYEGVVLFLEEDHYVSQDFLPVLKLMHSERSRVCPNCDILCLGTYLKTYNFQRNGHQMSGHFYFSAGGQGYRPIPIRHFLGSRRNLLWAASLFSSVFNIFQKVELTQWLSVKHNMGMAFTRDLWNRIIGCKSFFCNFDDYNWDWSLQHVSLSCLSQKIYVMLMKSPRVFHIGECGVHHKKSNCEASSVVKKVNDILGKAKKYLYPKKLEIVSGTRKGKPPKIRKGNGGWGDIRDQKLCLDLSKAYGEDMDAMRSYFY